MPLAWASEACDANIEASSIQLSYSHSIDYHNRDSSTYLKWIDKLETPLFLLAYHMIARTPFPVLQLDLQPILGLLPMPGPSSQFSTTSSMLPIPLLGTVYHEHNLSGLIPHNGNLLSLLYQIYFLAFSKSATFFVTSA